MAGSNEQRQRGALKCIRWAIEAAEAGDYAKVPTSLAHARANLNDGELVGIGRLYCAFFDLPEPVEFEVEREGPLAWLEAEAGAALDELHQLLIAAYRRRGGAWEGVAMEQAFLLEPTLEHRQVYADWLQMRSDPRGEFIALQMAYADHGLDDRGRARMEALLRTHIHAWAGAYLDRGAQISMFRRGFPAVIDQGRASVMQMSELGFRWRTIDRLIGRDAPELRACRHVRTREAMLRWL